MLWKVSVLELKSKSSLLAVGRVGFCARRSAIGAGCPFCRFTWYVSVSGSASGGCAGSTPELVAQPLGRHNSESRLRRRANIRPASAVFCAQFGFGQTQASGREDIFKIWVLIDT